MSPLTQGRELKPFVRRCPTPPDASPLTQGRELKPFRAAAVPRKLASPLTQGRELKRCGLSSKTGEGVVAPHAGA